MAEFSIDEVFLLTELRIAVLEVELDISEALVEASRLLSEAIVKAGCLFGEKALHLVHHQLALRIHGVKPSLVASIVRMRQRW